MDEGVITELIMITVVLVIGFILIVTMTPFLRSFSAPQAAPLVELIYSYSEYSINNNVGTLEIYFYIYDNNLVDLYSITVFTSQDLNINKIRIEGPNNFNESFTSGDNLDLTLSRGLYKVIVKYTVPQPSTLDQVSFILTWTGGHTISGETTVKKVT